MGFRRNINHFLSVLVVCCCSISSTQAEPYPGLPTRSQNPLLQGYFIPQIPVTTNSGWSFSNALYITNTYQIDESGTEQSIIDVENTRFDFQASYSHELWHFNIGIPIIDNSAGFMDQNIQGWHDFFGLPQGGRDKAENDRLRLLYVKDGNPIIDSEQSAHGLGDIQLALGYPLDENTTAWMALELPSNSSYEFISNDAVEFATWVSTSSLVSSKMKTYGTVGISLLQDKGVFEGLLEEQVLFAQGGLLYEFNSDYHFLIQADYHSPIVEGSELDVLEHSVQGQFALVLPKLINNQRLDIFFSEDILPGHAPDISFSIRLSTLSF